MNDFSRPPARARHGGLLPQLSPDLVGDNGAHLRYALVCIDRVGRTTIDACPVTLSGPEVVQIVSSVRHAYQLDRFRVSVELRKISDLAANWLDALPELVQDAIAAGFSTKAVEIGFILNR
jgi:hypothetical protein